MIVLKVIEHTKDIMNGIAYERYKMKLKANDTIIETTGFARAGTRINQYDIIENMQVVGKCTDREKCELYYFMQQVEKQQTPQQERKVIPFKKEKREEKKENAQLSLF